MSAVKTVTQLCEITNVSRALTNTASTVFLASVPIQISAISRLNGGASAHWFQAPSSPISKRHWPHNGVFGNLEQFGQRLQAAFSGEAFTNARVAELVNKRFSHF